MKNGELIGNNELYIRSISYVANSANHQSENEMTKGIHRNSDLFVFILDGLAEYHFDGKKHCVRTGDLIYLANGCDYDRHILSDYYHFICVDFSFDVSANTMLSQVYPAIQDMDTHFKKLYKVWSARETSFHLKSMSILYDICSRLVSEELSTYIPEHKRDVFKNIIEIISENYANKDISVQSLAKTANMSEVHFRKIFKTIYKMSPLQYMIFLRLERAKELLAFESTPVSEIGDMLGFTDSCHFSRVFKQKTGYTPLEYRKMFKGF